MEGVIRTLARSTRWWLAAAALTSSLAPPVAAQEVSGGGGWSPAAGAAGDNTYQGFIDRPATGESIPLGSPFHISGWIVDTSAEGWAGIDDVQVLNGNTVVAPHGTVALPRPDVFAATGNPYWAASGFDAVVPSGSVPSGPASLTLSAHTPGKGSWSKQVNVTITGTGAVVTGSASDGLVLTLIAPGPGEDVLANHNGLLRGVAYDTRTRAELGVGVDRVEVCLDGPCGTANSQTIGIANQTENLWTLAWEPTKYDHVKHHILYIYAHSSVTGEQRLLNREIDIVPF